jgi:glutamate/tyrosine decarboxylase-like PLP-dependent enzyme
MKTSEDAIPMEDDAAIQPRPRKQQSPDLVRPMYARQSLLGPTPRHSIPEQGMAPSTAYHLIHDELILDGSSRFNLAIRRHLDWFATQPGFKPSLAGAGFHH